MKYKYGTFDYINILLLASLALVVVYPLVYVVSLSLSDTDAAGICSSPTSLKFSSLRLATGNETAPDTGWTACTWPA